MATPKKLASDGHSPVKYDTDIDAVQTKVDAVTFQNMDKSEGSGVCDFQDKECGDGFSKKEEKEETSPKADSK